MLLCLSALTVIDQDVNAPAPLVLQILHERDNLIVLRHVEGVRLCDTPLGRDLVDSLLGSRLRSTHCPSWSIDISKGNRATTSPTRSEAAMGQAQTVAGLTRFMSVTMICHPCSRASERERAWPMPLPAPVMRARRVLDTDMDICRPMKQQTQGVRQSKMLVALWNRANLTLGQCNGFERPALMRLMRAALTPRPYRL